MIHANPFANLRNALTFAAMIIAPIPLYAENITVFAAASLKSSLTQVGDLWAAATGHTVKFSFAGTSALAKQIGEGAPADIFFSASTDWMDKMIETGDIRADTRREILGNRLVLIARGAGAAPVKLDQGLDLATMLAGEKLAMALIDAVPAGIYGKQALISLGLWDGVSGAVAQAENVAGALQFVATGEAPYGIVYASDAIGADTITVLGAFPLGSHTPITYPAAITSNSTADAAADFMDFLASSRAAQIWRANGFDVLP